MIHTGLSSLPITGISSPRTSSRIYRRSSSTRAWTRHDTWPRPSPSSESTTVPTHDPPPLADDLPRLGAFSHRRRCVADGRHPFVVSVMVAAQTPPLYAKLMAPQEGRGLNDVCAFVMALAERGVHVEATAVAAPGCATATATSRRPIAATPGSRSSS